MGEELAKLGMIMSIGGEDGGCALEAGEIPLVLDKFLLPPLCVPIDFPEDGGVDVGQLIGGDAHYWPVPVVKVQEFLWGIPPQVGNGAIPDDCTLESGPGVLPERVENNVVRHLTARVDHWLCHKLALERHKTERSGRTYCKQPQCEGMPRA